MMIRSLLMIAILLSLWQSLVILCDIPNYILPSPSQIFLVLIDQYQVLVKEAVPTIIEALLGFVLGIFFGCMAACAITFFKPLRLWFWPLLIMSQAIPIFAIAPLLVIWLGYGLASKIAVTVIMIFFPITSAFYDGLRRTPQGWLDLAKTMNGTSFRIFFMIRLPAALPALASGIRIAAVAAPMGAILGEWVGSSRGLGYLMLNANARMQIDLMFAALIVIITLAMVMYFSVDKILRSLITWQES